VDHVYDDIFELNNSKYNKNNLGYIVEKFEKQGNLDTLISTDDFYSRNNLKRKKYNSFYLRDLNGYQKYIAKILKFNTPMLPFKETEENMYSDMQLLVNAADMVEVILIYYYYYCINFKTTNKHFVLILRLNYMEEEHCICINLM
jgi:hypothetical protein